MFCIMPHTSAIQLLLWASLMTCGLSSPEQQVVLRPVPTSCDAVVSDYKTVFSSWTSKSTVSQHNGKSTLTFCTKTCFQGVCCPVGRIAAATSILAAAASEIAQPQQSSDAVDGDIAAVMSSGTVATMTFSPLPLPFTVASVPTRTTIYRRPTNVKACPQVESEVISSSEGSVDQSAQSRTNNETDFSLSYYDYTIEGHNAATISLILEDGKGTPVSLLSMANTVLHASYISADLVEQLNRTQHIITSKAATSAGTKDMQDFTNISGITATAVGMIDLDIIAGRKDRKLQAMPFTVFQLVRAAGDQEQKRWLPDSIVGLDLLNEADALRLSDEYEHVGAKEGLGIVVQRVIDSTHETVESTGERLDQQQHDEL